MWDAGRDLGTTDDNRLSHSTNSFASILHMALADRGLKVTVHARTHTVHIGNPVWDETYAAIGDDEASHYYGAVATGSADGAWES